MVTLAHSESGRNVQFRSKALISPFVLDINTNPSRPPSTYLYWPGNKSFWLSGSCRSMLTENSTSRSLNSAFCTLSSSLQEKRRAKTAYKRKSLRIIVKPLPGFLAEMARKNFSFLYPTWSELGIITKGFEHGAGHRIVCIHSDKVHQSERTHFKP